MFSLHTIFLKVAENLGLQNKVKGRGYYDVQLLKVWKEKELSHLLHIKYVMLCCCYAMLRYIMQ